MKKPVLGPLIAKGTSGEVYAWNQKQVLKLFFPWCSPDLVRREIKHARVARSKGLPTPKVIGSKKVDGRLGIIYERVDGPAMLTLFRATPWRLFDFARQFAEVHSLIHQQEVSGLRSLHSSFRERIEEIESPTLPATLKASVLQVLNRLPHGTTLCHYDFDPEQVLITESGPMVVDWTEAHQGNPLADVAMTCIVLTISDMSDERWTMRALTRLARGSFYRTYIARYLELNPSVRQEQINTWMIPAAAARLDEQIPEERDALLSLIESSLQEMVK